MTRYMTIAAAAAIMVLGVAAPSLSPSAHAAGHGRKPQHQRAAPPPAPSAQAARQQRGTASFYANRFNGRRMANGARFDARSNSAAHRTLPLGSTVRVTNLDNGRSAEVKVEDRGPYARNRVIDVSPRTANELGMRDQGTAQVVVTPLEVPDHDQRVAQR